MGFLKLQIDLRIHLSFSSSVLGRIGVTFIKELQLMEVQIYR